MNKRSLEKSLALACKEFDLAIRDAHSAVIHARNCGQHLLECLRQVEHGVQQDWLKTNFCVPKKVSYRTAAKWMQIAENWTVIEPKLPPTATIDQAASLAGKESKSKTKRVGKKSIRPKVEPTPPTPKPAVQDAQVVELTPERKVALESAVNAKLTAYGIAAETESIMKLLADLGLTPQELAAKLL